MSPFVRRGDINIYNKPCQCRYTDYWSDDTLGTNNPPPSSSNKTQITNKRQRKPKEQSKKDNPEKLAKQGTLDTGQINVRENRRSNQ